MAQSPTLTVDRDSGNLSFENQTEVAYEIIEYDIQTAGGNVNPANWNTIDEQNLDLDDRWLTLSSPVSRTDLAEATLGELVLTGETTTINFGNAWVPSPFEDVQMVLKLSDGSDVHVAVEYAGNGGEPFAAGDFNTDGKIDELDWPTIRDNLLGDISGLSSFDGYTRGDMNGNGSVDTVDFRLFKTAFAPGGGVAEGDDRIRLVIDPTNGLARIRGASASTIGIDFYRITSQGGFLISQTWNSLDAQGIHDSGDDPGWEQAGGPSPNLLAEALLRGDYVVEPGADVGNPLGAIWDYEKGPADPSTDLTFVYTLTGGADMLGIVEIGSLMDRVMAGDLNGDDRVDFADLTPFVRALADPADYAAMFPGLDRVARCDTSGDGSCTFADLTPFVSLLAGGAERAHGAQTVPEPTIAAYTALGIFSTIFLRKVLRIP
jgi:hypothetical protein